MFSKFVKKSAAEDSIFFAANFVEIFQAMALATNIFSEAFVHFAKVIRLSLLLQDWATSEYCLFLWMIMLCGSFAGPAVTKLAGRDPHSLVVWSIGYRDDSKLLSPLPADSNIMPWLQN